MEIMLKNHHSYIQKTIGNLVYIGIPRVGKPRFPIHCDADCECGPAVLIGTQKRVHLFTGAPVLFNTHKFNVKVKVTIFLGV